VVDQLTQQLSKLRDATLGADVSVRGSFNAVFSLFFDTIESTRLRATSKPYQHADVRKMLELLARTHTNDPAVQLTDLRMLRHAPSGLLHGNFFVPRQPASFFYFSEEQQGVLAFVERMSIMHYYRMTVSEKPFVTDPSLMS
jgi:hypothetical protein